jgi:hypothetical protein
LQDGHQIRGILQRGGFDLAILRPIATERQHISNTPLHQATDDVADLLLVVSEAGKVGHPRSRQLLPESAPRNRVCGCAWTHRRHK